MSKYMEQLRDPRWQQKRLQVFERDNWTCVHCGSKDKTLHAHHRFYVSGRAAWDYSTNALETVCEDCHKQDWVHSTVEGIELLLGSLRALAPKGESVSSVIYGLIVAIDNGIVKLDVSGNRFFEDGVCAHSRIPNGQWDEFLLRLTDLIQESARINEEQNA